MYTYFVIVNEPTVTQYAIKPKISEVENFRGFGSENGHKKFLTQNFKFITDARHGS